MMGENLEQDISVIKETLTGFERKLDTVYSALVGNRITKDGGLVADIVEQKEKIEGLRARIEKVEAKESKRQLYVKIIYGCVGSIITYMVVHFLK